MAEVAASPSQTSAAVASSAVAAGGRAAFDSSPVARAAFPQALDQHANTHGLPSHAHAHHHTHGHRPHVQYTAAASPSDADAAFFSHNPRLSPGAPVHLEPAERAIPRGLPPLVSSMTGAPSPSASYGDSRAPVSPSAVSLSLSDPSQGLDGQGDSAPRKRSKVSRACDECRRKKVGELPCSSAFKLAYPVLDTLRRNLRVWHRAVLQLQARGLQMLLQSGAHETRTQQRVSF